MHTKTYVYKHIYTPNAHKLSHALTYTLNMHKFSHILSHTQNILICILPHTSTHTCIHLTHPVSLPFFLKVFPLLTSPQALLHSVLWAPQVLEAGGFSPSQKGRWGQAELPSESSTHHSLFITEQGP